MNDQAYQLIGTVLEGKYTLVAVIGQGGQGAVYRATHEGLREVAIKVILPHLPPHVSRDGSTLRRFEQEAKIIAQFYHPNIIPLYDYGVHNQNLPYLVMPYLAQGSLMDLLRRQGPFSLSTAASYLDQVANALDYAHSRQIIHRDLKPANFLLHEEGKVILADFGIARLNQPVTDPEWSPLTNSNTLIGTLAYMAPEILRGETVDYRADLYALGIVIFHWLSGSVPFQGSNDYSIIIQHLEKSLPSLHTTNAAIPPQVDDVLQQATAKNREDRYPSAHAFSTAFQRAMTTPRIISPLPPLPLLRPLPSPAKPEEVSPSPQQATPRHTTHQPRTRRAISLPLFLIILLAFGLTISKLLPIDATSSLGSPAKVSHPTVPSQIQATLHAYYTAVNAHDYLAAYTLLLSKQRPPYCQFVNSYALTEQNTLQVNTIVFQPGQQRWEASFSIHALEMVSTGSRESVYKTLQPFENEQGTWKLVWIHSFSLLSQGAIHPLRVAGTTSTEVAKATVQRYYDFLNQHDYPESYQLWGSTFHQTTTYCDFVNGYTQTKHHYITFGTIAVQADKTVAVTIRIDAREASSLGKAINKSYNWKGILSPEEGTWKIQSATMNSRS